MNYPYILVLHEKWGDAFFLMNEPQDVLDFAMETLSTRFGQGYYHRPEMPAPSFDEYFHKVHNMSAAEATALIENHGEALMLGNRTIANEIKSMKAAYVHLVDEVEEYAQITYALEEKNGKLAWRVLSERSGSGYQYENFSIEQIENKKVDN